MSTFTKQRVGRGNLLGLVLLGLGLVVGKANAQSLQCGPGTPLIASAGPDQSVAEGVSVVLNGAGSSAPSVDQVQNGVVNGTNNLSQSFRMAQTFTVGRTGILRGVDFCIAFLGSDPDVTVSIQRVNATGLPDDSQVLGTATLRGPGIVGPAALPRFFDMTASNISVVAGEQLAAVISSTDNPPVTGDLGLIYSSAAPGPYASGAVYFTYSTSTGQPCGWCLSGPRDLYFRTYVDLPTGPAPLTYEWSPVSGPAVTLLGANTAAPNFAAPYVSANQTLTFRLTVRSPQGASATDTVDVTVVNANHPPVAEAGADSTIKFGATKRLDGSNSYDPDGDAVASFQWLQASGTAVPLSGGATAQPSFVAPAPIGGELFFKLRVSDGKESSVPSVDINSSLPDTVRVTVVSNSPPLVKTGPNQTADEGTQVVLSGATTSDPDADALSLSWVQTAGPAVPLQDANTLTPKFVAPLIGAGGATLAFRLTAMDNDPFLPLFASDVVSVFVRDLNDPPVCSNAAPSVAVLWPPNHKMHRIGIDGITDPDSATVTTTIDGVTSDEPTNGVGDGDTGPDAVIEPQAVLVRAERAGFGNGRVYAISFTARDQAGSSCTGSVRVQVPRNHGSVAIDDGQFVDATR